MAHALLSLPFLLLALIIVGGTVLCTVSLLLLIRPAVKNAVSEGHNDIAGWIFASLSLMYGIVVAFLLVAVWNEYTSATANVQGEAVAVSALWTEAAFLPPPVRTPAHQALQTFVHDAVQDDWEAMKNGQDSPRVDGDITRVRLVYRRLNLADPRQNLQYQDAISHVDQLEAQRNDLVGISRQDLSPLLWFGLIVGAILTIGFACVFYMENTRVQILGTSIFAAYVATLLVLILVIDHAFIGPNAVPATDLRDALTHAHHTLAHLHRP